MRHVMGLPGWIGLCLLAGLFGAQFAPGGEWFGQLQKPAVMPPAWLFAPVWTVLYLLMGLAAWRVWCRVGYRWVAGPLLWFEAQLVANALWSWVFFGLRRPGWALVDLGLLALLLGTTLALFFRRDPIAGGLLIPYGAWVLFALYLNFEIWRLNPLTG